MRREKFFWIVLFAAGLLTVLFRMDISRFYSDITALLVFGSLLAAVGGAGLLLECFQKDK